VGVITVGVIVGLGVRVGVGVVVGEGVRVGLGVLVGVGVEEGVRVGEGVQVCVGVRVRVGVPSTWGSAVAVAPASTITITNPMAKPKAPTLAARPAALLSDILLPERARYGAQDMRSVVQSNSPVP
jgi:hypothetical protein